MNATKSTTPGASEPRRSRPSPRLLLAALAATISLVGPTPWLRAADWPQWRGPHRDGHAPGLTLPATLPSPLPCVWRVATGEGYSAPAIAEGAAVVLFRQGQQEVVLCLDSRDGKERWRDTYDAAFRPDKYAEAHGQGPFATPTVHAGRVYVHGISGALSCYELSTGTRRWRKDFSGEFKKPHGIWGVATSPLIEGGLCITGVGTEEDGAIAGFRAGSGELAWQLPGREPSYSSPVAVELAGRRQVVVLTRTQVLGLLPQNGQVLWELPYRVKYDQNVVTPTVARDWVFVAGWQEPTVGVRVTAAAGKMSATRAWANPRVSFFMSSPVYAGGHLYGLAERDKGSLVCLDASNGELAWQSEGGMGDYASLVVAGEKLLVLTDRGVLRVVATDPRGYRELQRLKVADPPVWAHLAVASHRIFLKDKTHLSCLALQAE